MNHKDFLIAAQRSILEKKPSRLKLETAQMIEGAFSLDPKIVDRIAHIVVYEKASVADLKNPNYVPKIHSETKIPTYKIDVLCTHIMCNLVNLKNEVDCG